MGGRGSRCRGEGEKVMRTHECPGNGHRHVVRGSYPCERVGRPDTGIDGPQNWIDDGRNLLLSCPREQESLSFACQ